MTTDRTFRIPADATGGCHTDPTGTIAHRPASGGATFSHTGPANGCTLPGCSTTPDDSQTARWARREPLAVLLSRMQRGALLPQERDLLRAAVQTELADGDQAREQLAEARALRFGAHDIEVCNQQRAAHTGLRKALQSAFGVGDSVSDDDLFECVRQQAADLAAARAGDAPWIRAYGEDIEHARQGEAEAVRARTAAEQRAEAMTRAMESTAADALKHGGCHRELMAQCQRAERAEATLTAVRKAVGTESLRTITWTERDARLTAVRAALGDPQPAAEPECPCGTGGVGDYEGPARDCPVHGEQPTEPEACRVCGAPDAPAIHVHLDARGAVYHPWPQEWREQPTEGGKSEYRRNVEREAEQRVTVYGISVNEWDRLWLTVQRIADAAGVKPA